VVIEHEFISTLEPTDVMRRSAEYLAARGFEPATDNGGAFALDSGGSWTHMEMRRGKKASRAKSVSQLPQTVRLEWDRGRVTLALSIGANAAWGGGSSFSLGNVAGKPKKMRLHTALLNAIAGGLEDLLGHDRPQQPDYSAWDNVEEEITRVARRRSRRNALILFVVVLLLGGMIALIAAYA
jgi:hypothetical protein